MDCIIGLNWPEFLPSCETSSKSRNQPEGYKFNNVNSGPPILEKFSDDNPTLWDITFKFTRDQARIFKIWLNQNNMRTSSPWFEFPIQIEEGLTTQEVRFLSYPQLTGQDGNAFSYSAKIIAREIVSSDQDCPEGTVFIIMNKNCNSTFEKAAACFGDAINIGWPS